MEENNYEIHIETISAIKEYLIIKLCIVRLFFVYVYPKSKIKNKVTISHTPPHTSSNHDLKLHMMKVVYFH